VHFKSAKEKQVYLFTRSSSYTIDAILFDCLVSIFFTF